MEETKKKNRTSAKSVNKYIKNNYSRITVLCKPSEAEQIRRQAAKYDMTVTQFILLCVRRYMHGIEL